MSIALPTRHYVAIFLLGLASTGALVVWQDHPAEVADCIPRRGQLSHFHGSCPTRRVRLVDSRGVVRPKSCSCLGILAALAAYVGGGAAS